MKRKIFSVLFALVLVASFSLVTAVPAAAGAPTVTLTTPAGGIDSLTGVPTGSGTEAGVHSIVITDATASTLTGTDAEHDTTADTMANALVGTEVLTLTIGGTEITTAALASATAGTTLLTDVAADIQAKINAATTSPDVDITVTVAGTTPGKYFVITVNLAGVSNSITTQVTGTGATPTGLAGQDPSAGTDAKAVDTFTAAIGSNGLWVADPNYGNTANTMAIAHSPAAGTASTLGGLEALVEAADAFIQGVTLDASAGLSAGTAEVTVSAGTAGYLAVTGTGTMTAGTTNELTVSAYDDADNQATSYTGGKVLTFSGPSQAPDGTDPTVEGTVIGQATAINFTTGVSDVNAATLVAYKAEVTTVDVSDGTIDSTADPAYDLDLTVNPASIHHFALVTENAGTEVAGVAFDVTLTAQDDWDNTATGYTGGAVSVTFTTTATSAPDTTSPTIPSPQTLDFSVTPGIATATGFILVDAGETPTIAASDGTYSGTTAAITVNPAAFAEYTVVPAVVDPYTAGTPFAVTITAVDEFQNLSPSGIDDTTLNTYTFTFSGPGDAPDGTAPTYPTTPAFTGGAWTDNVTLVKAESVALTVTDNQSPSMTGTSATITVNPGDAVSLGVTGIADPITKGTPSNVTITAYDTYENTATGYLGTVHFTSTDTAATLPGDYEFQAGDNGVHIFAGGVTFQTVGQHSVTATDTTDATITGTQSGIGVYDKLISLNPDGWTLISTDDYIISSGNTTSVWEATVTLVYKHTGTGYLSATFADLEPVEALYVKITGSGENAAGLNYSTAGAPGASIKDLVAGWNLVSSATTTGADIVLSPLRYVQIGEQEGTGLATLVSQGSYNMNTADWYIDATTWGNLAAKVMSPFDGYWVYMNAGKSFGVIP